MHSENYEYRDYKEGIEITRYIGSNKEVIIPKEIEEKSVIKIGDSTFTKRMITSVVIPSSVIEIGERSFFHNKLTSITIPDSAKSVGKNAFFHNNITEAALPNGVTIEEQITQDDQFGYNYNVKNKTITIRKYYGSDKDLTIPEKIGNKKVTKIGFGSIAGKNLTSVVIPEYVTEIDSGAFNGNNLKSVELPEGIESIGGYSFANNNLESIDLKNTKTLGKEAFASNRIGYISMPGDIKMDEGFNLGNKSGEITPLNEAFRDNKRITHIYIDGKLNPEHLEVISSAPNIFSNEELGIKNAIKVKDKKEFKKIIKLQNMF